MTTAALCMTRTASRSRTGGSRTRVDGASAYRLDWNGMCVSYTGDGRPNSLTIEYDKGCDLVITEVQCEVVASQRTGGRRAAVHRAQHHRHGAQPGLCGRLPLQQAQAATRDDDPLFVRSVHRTLRSSPRFARYWKGPFRFGAPDLVVVNMTKDKIWVREGVVPKYPACRIAQVRYEGERRGDASRHRGTGARTSKSSRSATRRSRRTRTTRRDTSPRCCRIGRRTNRSSFRIVQLPEAMKLNWIGAVPSRTYLAL